MFFFQHDGDMVLHLSFMSTEAAHCLSQGQLASESEFLIFCFVNWQQHLFDIL